MYGIEGMNNLYEFTSTAPMIPMYGNSFQINSDHGLTYTHDVSRKRSRQDNALNFTFLGEDFSSHMHQEKLQLDGFVKHHNEKVRLELEDYRKRYCRKVLAAVEESMMMKLKSKEEEIHKIWKLNFALEERVKSLAVENQIYRDLAQSSEATANALRSNLEQVLSIVQGDHRRPPQGGGSGGVQLQDDAESFCGSNYEEEGERRMLAGNVVKVSGINGVDGSSLYRGRENRSVCRSCGKEEASVLLLPCRHLCLCGVCGASVHNCPICNSTLNCSLLVNM